MSNSINNFISSRKNELVFYSNYNFVRDISDQKHLELVTDNLINFLDKNNNNIFLFIVDNHEHYFYLSYLEWDSRYFNIDTYKLINVLYSHNDINLLSKAIVEFKNKLFELGKVYCFIEIPSEDILLIQALGNNSFKLVETRLNYFRGNLNTYSSERFPVRVANTDDIENLKRVASEMRNDYDRFHADKIFSLEVADKFLSTYIEESIKGFSDVVLIPNSNECPSDGFLTANYLKNDWDKMQVKVSKMVLSAVSPTCKGWYKKLISEMTYYLYESGAEYIYMNTQSTNRAVFKVWQDLGYKLGSSIHILAINN